MERKDEWPYLASFAFTVAVLIAVQFTVQNRVMQLTITLLSLVVSSLTAMFVCLLINKELTHIPVYKKFIVSYCPLLMLSSHFRRWIVK
jgi:hypothetical protein